LIRSSNRKAPGRLSISAAEGMETMSYTEPATAESVTKIDESVWKAGQYRSRLKSERAAGARLAAVRIFSAAALLGTLVLWLDASQFGLLLKTVVAAGAAVVACHAVSMRCYGIGLVFAGIVFLFNPFVAIFNLSGVWGVGSLLIAMGSFLASLVWLRTQHRWSS
jgi:hypothetical protein